MKPLPLEPAFRGRSVLITGHTGFKGSWLALWLSHLGAKVTGYALAPPTTPSNFAVSRMHALLAGHHEADIRDADRLAHVLAETKPDVIFHLAAQSLVRESYANPRHTFDTNVMGTVNLLEALRRRARPCAVVIVTSDKCYESRPQVSRYRESDTLGGHDPYSASKAVAELVTAAYRRSFFDPARLQAHGVKVASARAGNAIGGGDWARDRIVVDAVTHLAQGQAVPVRNPQALRPWQHVLAPLSGYLQLAARLLESADPRYCAPWNFGPRPEDEATVKDLVEGLCRAWGNGRWTDTSDPSQPHETAILRLSIDKAQQELGWRPTWHLAEAISRTVAWYRRYYEAPAEPMRDACLADLSAFMAAQERLP